jgi:hypothetical protein
VWLYLGGAWFESLPGHSVSWPNIYWFSSVPPGECKDSTLKRHMTTSFHIVSKISFIGLPVCAIDSIVVKQQMNKRNISPPMWSRTNRESNSLSEKLLVLQLASKFPAVMKVGGLSPYLQKFAIGLLSVKLSSRDIPKCKCHVCLLMFRSC